MRKVINKNLTEIEILSAAQMLVAGGVENLKLYFMIGLPEEHDEDVIEIAHLTLKILERAREQKKHVGRVTVSLNPFVPKPWTPFQWDPMEHTQSIKHKVALLRAERVRMSGGSTAHQPPTPRAAPLPERLSPGG